MVTESFKIPFITFPLYKNDFGRSQVVGYADSQYLADIFDARTWMYAMVVANNYVIRNFISVNQKRRMCTYDDLDTASLRKLEKNSPETMYGVWMKMSFRFFYTYTFRHCYGKKLTEMHIDDWMIARLLGHKTLQSVHHYRKIGNKIMADETRAVREKIDMILMDVVKEWDGYEI